MLRGEETGLTDADRRAFRSGAFGMERYDWYLVVSPVSELPMPSPPQPCSIIGIDLDDGTLFPEQGGEFRVLVDFEQTRKDYLSFRDVQLKALEKSGIPFQVLDRPMTRDEIRAIYRKTGAFLMAHRESFGLPLCELQACGSLIFTPQPEWAGAHWMKPDLSVPGPGTHSRNFVVYANNVDNLVARLERASAEFNPARVREEFLTTQPQLYRGDRSVLSDFFRLVENGTIHSRTHTEHGLIGR
jgi:glycosyltransferase involved in cell wall biosynthesis